jgi:hypothetical protein
MSELILFWWVGIFYQNTNTTEFAKFLENI